MELLRFSSLLVAVITIVTPVSFKLERFPVQPKLFAATPTEVDLAGVYICEGENPNGSLYSGFVQIVKVEESYMVRWTMSDSRVTGVGIRNDNTLSVSYFAGSPAVVLYSIEADGKLTGKWTMMSAPGALFRETLTKTTERPKLPKPRTPVRPSPGRIRV